MNSCLHSFFFTCSEVQLDVPRCIRELLEVTSLLARLCRAQVAHLDLIFSTDATELYSSEAPEHDVQMSLQRSLCRRPRLNHLSLLTSV